MKLTLLAPWIGATPRWLPRFRERLSASEPLVKLEYIEGTWEYFRGRIRKALGVEPPMSAEAIKLCDYRPAFGEVFGKEIGDSDWWGWVDLDCVLGDVPAFLTPERLEAYDLITDHASIVNGPLTCIRNTPYLNRLYRQDPEIHEVLTSPAYFNFDENRHRAAGASDGFTAVVRGAPEVRALYLNAHLHDRSSPRPRLQGKRLVCGDREVLTYHFTAGKSWPLS